MGRSRALVGDESRGTSSRRSLRDADRKAGGRAPLGQLNIAAWASSRAAPNEGSSGSGIANAMGDGASTAVVPSDEDRAGHCNALQDAQVEGTEYDADERASAPEDGVQAAGQRSSSLGHLTIGGLPEHRAVGSGYQGVAQEAQ